jgi:hypothetical protein
MPSLLNRRPAPPAKPPPTATPPDTPAASPSAHRHRRCLNPLLRSERSQPLPLVRFEPLTNDILTRSFVLSSVRRNLPLPVTVNGRNRVRIGGNRCHADTRFVHIYPWFSVRVSCHAGTALQAGCRRFDPCQLHLRKPRQLLGFSRFQIPWKPSTVTRGFRRQLAGAMSLAAAPSRRSAAGLSISAPTTPMKVERPTTKS